LTKTLLSAETAQFKQGKRMGKSTALLLVLVFLKASCSITFLPVQAESRTIVVPDDYPTIQAAIGNAGVGDTVFVRKGTYEEQQLMINETITLTGDNPENTKINIHPTWIDVIPPNPSYYDAAIKIKANDVKISGFTITSDGSISIEGNETQVAYNLIDASIVMNGYNQTITLNQILKGITCKGSYSSIAANNFTIIGIYVLGSSNFIQDNNVFNIPSTAGAITSSGDDNIIAKNNITNARYDGVYIVGSRNIICGNRITHSSQGLELTEGNDNLVYANFIGNNHWGVSMAYPELYKTHPLTSPITFINTFYHNNFVNNIHQVNTEETRVSTYPWGNVTAILHHHGLFDKDGEGNYWDDYIGSDDDNDGIGDLPYIIDSTRSDNYPLIAPFDISSVTVELPEWASSIPFETKELNPPEPFPVVPVAVASVIVAVVGVGVLVYFKKRKH
jgi:nitrous oxidase accessory protein NosD